MVPLLEARRYHVAAVQNPLTSLADDVAATKRIIARQDGPVILVGHSWGGAVISQAGDDPKFAGLVCVAAYSPDADQFAYMTSQGIEEDLAQRVTAPKRKLVPAAEGESYGPMFGEKLTVAAWKTKPSWIVIFANDRVLPPPAMERADARKINAKATTLTTCHLAMLEERMKVTGVIDDAAKTALDNEPGGGPPRFEASTRN